MLISYAVDDTYGNYKTKLHAEFDLSVSAEFLGAATLTAVRKSRLLEAAECDFTDVTEKLRGKKSHTAFHKGMGMVAVEFFEDQLHVAVYESIGRGHLEIGKLSKSFPETVKASTIGPVLLKYLKASQQISIPVVGWDRRTARPLK